MIRPRLRQGSIVALALLLLSGCSGSGEGADEVGETETVAPGEDFLATLCFPSTLASLHCDRRPVRAEDSAEATAAVIVDALIAGPRGIAGPGETRTAAPTCGSAVSADVEDVGERTEPLGDLLPALPAGVRLLAVDLFDGIAYVDLTTDLATGETGAGTGGVRAAGRSTLVLEGPAMGLTEELLAVYSLVNSLTASNLGVDQVVLMWNGEQRPTFAGHVDTTRPLMADLSRNAAPTAGS